MKLPALINRSRLRAPSARSRLAHRLLLAAAATVAACVWLHLPLCRAQERLDAEAFSGTPLGVGRVTLQSGGDFRFNRQPGAARGRLGDLARRLIDQSGKQQPLNLDSSAMPLAERSNRVFYPVFEKRERPILREFVAVPTQSTLFFLFQGDAPLDLTVYTPGPQSGQIVPQHDPAGHARLLRAWWRDFSAAATTSRRDYSPLVEEYLADMLAVRLRVPAAERPTQRQSGLLQSEMSLLAGTESARIDAARAILLGEITDAPATLPLPEELPQAKLDAPNPPGDAPIEPIAMRVPLECFYVRFGNFGNFLWLRHRLEDWGGELRDVISERGLEYGINERLQRQLGMRESALAEVLGERVIADIALVGTDTFLSEGAAIGLLFQAKSSAVLSAGFSQQLRSALSENKGAKLEKLTIEGHPVTFASTPDNSLRSFYVADGDYHFVTTSRTLVEWFLAVAAGKHDSLGASEAFRLARTNMPLTRDDTIFAYLSPTFFQNLLSPRYHIELERRLRSAVEIELLDIAQLAARSELKPADTIDDLVAGQMLPRGFGTRPDGSRLEIVGGRAIDSLRGAAGTFLPIPDVAIGPVTEREMADYRRFAEYYTAEWGPMDPVVAAIQRQALPEGKLERVVLDAEAAPLSRKHVELLNQWLGAPSDQRLAPVEGDVVAIEAIVRGGTFFGGDEHHLFGALRDADPAVALDPQSGLLARIVSSKLEGLQGYIGAWPNVGFLRFIGGSSDIRPDGSGYSRLRTGLWRRQYDGFTLMSFHPEILDQVSSQLHFEQAERPAQIRIRADDLAHSRLAPLLNAYGYRQSRQIAAGNAAYMNMLADQLHIPPADCRATAERLLGAKLLSPLGGDYELRGQPGAPQTWVATALDADASKPPADYQLPALNWLRGVQLEVRAQGTTLAAHAELIMPVETRPAMQLPSLPFGLGNLGAGKSTMKPAPPTPRGLNPGGTKPSGRREF